MRIHPSDQADADIDWFATDAAGHVLHVASGGGRLPESVAADEAALLELHAYFLNLPETTAAEPGAGLTVNSPTYPSHPATPGAAYFPLPKPICTTTRTGSTMWWLGRLGRSRWRSCRST
ncbi:hypothetical protein [Hymenobacter weizhouensis]|uniref:hypothetical protein n=1 Tax=Hymenobacter sp. YIM 151500-1 TaxID=2987689 RepID=UPI002226AF1C|nr:hypothetical protein [Hymenobacter sp. YIM 151500-1]UYZ63237.1 hypothetical protein OIS53_19875 [Hymenobacter sp. YIM 151500-1]